MEANGDLGRFDPADESFVALPAGAMTWGVTVDAAGRAYAINRMGMAVRVFEPDGTVVGTFGGLPELNAP